MIVAKHHYLRSDSTITSKGWVEVDEKGQVVKSEVAPEELELIPGFYLEDLEKTTLVPKGTYMVNGEEIPYLLLSEFLSKPDNLNSVGKPDLTKLNKVLSGQGFSPLSGSQRDEFFETSKIED